MAAISAERSRPVKLTLARDLLVLSASSPEQGTASEELDGGRVTYEAGPLEIGFQARYLNDITDQIGDGGVPLLRRRRADGGAGRRGCQRAVCADADAGVAAPCASALSWRGTQRQLRWQEAGRCVLNRSGMIFHWHLHVTPFRFGRPGTAMPFDD